MGLLDEWRYRLNVNEEEDGQAQGVSTPCRDATSFSIRSEFREGDPRKRFGWTERYKMTTTITR